MSAGGAGMPTAPRGLRASEAAARTNNSPSSQTLMSVHHVAVDRLLPHAETRNRHRAGHIGAEDKHHDRLVQQAAGARSVLWWRRIASAVERPANLRRAGRVRDR